MARKDRPFPLTAEETRFRFDQWVERHLVIEEQHGPEWVCVCPKCNRPKLAVHVGRKAFQCLAASSRFASWSPTRLVAGALDVPIERAREIVAAAGLGMEIGPVQALAPSESHRIGPLPLASLPLVDWQLRRDQAEYITSRGVPSSHIPAFGLGTVMSNGTGSRADYALTGRVIFPAWDAQGRMVFWTARAIGQSKAKTINMPRPCREANHSEWCACYHSEWGLPEVPMAATADEVVLGLHQVRRGEPVIVVEGPIDMAVCGPGFVSVMRAWISPAQAALIAGTGASEAIILFDGDAPDPYGKRAGEEGLKKSLPILSAAMTTRGLTCPEGEDPGSMGRQESLRLALTAPEAASIQQLSSSGYIPIARTRSSPPFQAGLSASVDRDNGIKN